MKRNYTGLWALLATAFVIFVSASAFDSIELGPVKLKTPSMLEAVTSAPAATGAQAGPGSESAATGEASDRPATAQTKVQKIPAPLDTATKTILFIGDSMLEGLAPRLAAYCDASGHTLYSVIWYSSTSERWGSGHRLPDYIERVRPDYVFICLGSNELFVRDIKEKRDKYVKTIIGQLGDLPFLWIGPPNWKPDTGINELIEANAPRGSYFKSDGMHFDRKKDGAHPTPASAALWMDSVVRWMPAHSNHPIRLDKPAAKRGRAKRTFIHQPNET